MQFHLKLPRHRLNLADTEEFVRKIESFTHAEQLDSATSYCNIIYLRNCIAEQITIQHFTASENDINFSCKECTFHHADNILLPMRFQLSSEMTRGKLTASKIGTRLAHATEEILQASAYFVPAR